MTETTAVPTLVFVEHVLWEPDDAWTAALEHVAGRFARVSPLDVDAVVGAGAFHEQVAQLATWADDAKVDLDRELGRFLDEHLSMHVRPKPAITRAVRALAAEGPLHAVSALPPRAAESIARHAGCWRSFEALHGNVRDAADLDRELGDVAATRVVAAGATPVPASATQLPLA